MIQSVDDGVGKIVETLESLGVRDNTMIMFYSDNGGYGPATDMDPLKGYKGTYYEGGIRVPFFVNWPGKVKPESKSAEPITGVDIYPTFLRNRGRQASGWSSERWREFGTAVDWPGIKPESRFWRRQRASCVVLAFSGLPSVVQSSCRRTTGSAVPLASVWRDSARQVEAD